MRRGTICVTMAVLSIAFSGCAGKTKADVRPLLGLKWFASCDDVKASLGSYKLLDERENKDSGNSVHQTMLDYSDVRLYETDCDLTRRTIFPKSNAKTITIWTSIKTIKNGSVS